MANRRHAAHDTDDRHIDRRYTTRLHSGIHHHSTQGSPARHFDGRDYLTLHIGGHEVGPSSCRSNVLRMDTGSETGAVRQEEIERLALTAMLSKALIIVVVPLDATQCVDGKPTFTDLYLLPPSL